MDSELSRDEELAAFFKEDIQNIDKDELLMRPTTELVTAFLFSFVRLCPSKSNEKFGEYVKQVMDKYTHICSGDLRTARAEAAFFLARPFLSSDQFTLSIFDILNPTPARTKAMVLECMNFFGFVNFIEIDGDSYYNRLVAWEERNAGKADHEALVQKLVKDIDQAKTAREKARVTSNALNGQRQKLKDEIELLVREKEQIEEQRKELKAEIEKEKAVEDGLDEEIAKFIMEIETLNDQIVESPEKASVEIAQLLEALQKLRVEVNEAEEMHQQTKMNTALRRGATQALKKDMDVLQQIVQATDQIEKAVRHYQEIQERLSLGHEHLQEAKLRKTDAQNRLQEAEAKNRPKAIQINEKIGSLRDEVAEMETECEDCERRLNEDEIARTEILELIQSLGKELQELSALPNLYKYYYDNTMNEMVDTINQFAAESVRRLEK